MAWPKRVYAATKTKGLYVASSFTASGDQPVWAPLNAGLPSTAIHAFCLDRHEATHDARMFCVVNQIVYGRSTGDWEELLTTEEARAMLGFVNGEYIQYVITDPITGYLYVSVSREPGESSAIGVCISHDHGETWQSSVVRVKAYQYVTEHPIDAYDGMIVMMYSVSPISQHTAYSKDHGVTWTKYSVGSLSSPGWLPARIHQGITDYYYGCRFGGFYDLLRCSTLANEYTDVNPADNEDGPYSQGGMWFDRNDPLHIITLPGLGHLPGQCILETFDGFATPGTKRNQNVCHVPEIAAECDNGYFVLGSDSNGTAVYVSTDGVTLSHRSGANWNTSPYTGSIPTDSGGICQWGLWAVMEPSSGGPTVPPGGGTITPPGYGGPITLVGTGGYTQAVSFPGYTGIDRGEPMPGDRGAWDTVEYASLHARDIQDAAPTVHNPTDGNVGDVPMWDGDKYVATDVLTPAEHTAIGNGAPHHAPVTLGAGSDAELATLVGQELTVVLKDHAHDGSAGEGGQIEATNLKASGASDDQVLTATGGVATWATLVIPDTGGGLAHQYTYVPDGAGSWAFVVDDNGLPVFMLTSGESGGGASDASDLTYTPVEVTDWNDSADPGNADYALDQLAERVADLEGSSGFSYWEPDAPPASPTEYDDEFDDASFDTGLWTELDPNNILTISEGPHGLVLTEATRAGDNVTGVFQPCPAGDFAIICKPSLSAKQADYAQAGLLLGTDLVLNPSSSGLISLHLTVNGGGNILELLRWNNCTSYNGSLSRLGSGLETAKYLRLRRIGTTIYADYSHDGIGWIQVYSGAQPWTINQIGLMCNNVNTGVTITAYHRFFRFTADTSMAAPIAGRLCRKAYA